MYSTWSLFLDDILSYFNVLCSTCALCILVDVLLKFKVLCTASALYFWIIFFYFTVFFNYDVHCLCFLTSLCLIHVMFSLLLLYTG